MDRIKPKVNSSFKSGRPRAKLEILSKRPSSFDHLDRSISETVYVIFDPMDFEFVPSEKQSRNYKQDKGPPQ